MRRVIMVAAAGIFASLTAAHAQAPGTYPDRPIKVVVPAAAGGVTDTPARIVTNRMRDSLGQPFVVETLKELGYTAEYYAWSGFVAPAGTPQAVVDRINTSANTALTDPDVIKALTANGFEIVGDKPEIFANAMSAYIRDVREIGRKNGLEIE